MTPTPNKPTSPSEGVLSTAELLALLGQARVFLSKEYNRDARSLKDVSRQREIGSLLDRIGKPLDLAQLHQLKEARQ